jgi:hypothetical protein
VEAHPSDPLKAIQAAPFSNFTSVSQSPQVLVIEFVLDHHPRHPYALTTSRSVAGNTGIPELLRLHAGTDQQPDEELQTAAQWDWHSQTCRSFKDGIYARLCISGSRVILSDGSLPGCAHFFGAAATAHGHQSQRWQQAE